MKMIYFKRRKIFFVTHSVLLLVFMLHLLVMFFSGFTGAKTTKRLERAILKNENVGKIVDCYLVDEDKETANIIIELKNGICLEFSDIKFKGKDLIFYKLVSVNECCIMYTELYDDYNFQHSICWDRIIDTNFVYEIIDNADWILKKSLSYPLIRTYLYDNRIFFDEVKVSDDFIEINNGTIKKYFRIERDYI